MAKLIKPQHFMLGGQFGVNVKDFGPSGMVGNGDPVYDGPALIAAQAYLNTASEERGGTLILPRGQYRPTQTFDCTNHALVTNIFVQGEGEINTQVYGDAMPDGTDVFSFKAGTHFGLSRMMIANAKRNGVRIRGGEYGTNVGYVAHGDVRDLRIQGSVDDGLYSENSFMLTIENIWSSANGQCGFNFRGFHTSIKFGRCFASGHHEAPGFQCNSMIYSSMTTCGSDDNKWGYAFSNIRGFSMVGCGAESNHNESIIMQANDAVAVGALQESADITAFTIQGGYFMHGNKAGADGAASSFIGAVADNNRKIDVTLVSCSSLKNPDHANDPAIAGTAITAGSVVRFRGMSNNFDSANQFAGAGTAEFVGT